MSHVNPEAIGVTTSSRMVYDRTSYDNKLQSEFNPVYQKDGPPKPFQYEAFSYRTNFDKKVLNQFDPLYRDHSSVQEAYLRAHNGNAQQGRVAEKYCTGMHHQKI